jgi:hypothetical protein
MSYMEYAECIRMLFVSSEKMAATGNFEFLFTVQSNGSIPVSKYRSKTTGLSVFIAQVEGPLVNGYFCLGIDIYWK